MPNGSTQVVAPALHHVNLKTTQLDAMVQWYGTVVGSKPTFQFPCGAWEKSKKWMETSPEFAENPIGVFFEPDKLLAAHRAGGDLADLHRRMMAAEFEPNPVPVLRVPDPV